MGALVDAFQLSTDRKFATDLASIQDVLSPRLVRAEVASGVERWCGDKLLLYWLEAWDVNVKLFELFNASVVIPTDRYNEYGNQLTLSAVESFLEGQKRTMMKNYRVHVNNVMRVVPQDQLLVWNIKDGWEPVCRFLGKPVPNKPFPFENATGDKSKKNEFIEKYVYESDIMSEGQSIFKWNCTVYIACPLILAITGCCYFHMNKR